MNAILYLGNLGGRFTLRFFEIPRHFARWLVILGLARFCWKTRVQPPAVYVAYITRISCQHVS